MTNSWHYFIMQFAFSRTLDQKTLNNMYSQNYCTACRLDNTIALIFATRIHNYYLPGILYRVCCKSSSMPHALSWLDGIAPAHMQKKKREREKDVSTIFYAIHSYFYCFSRYNLLPISPHTLDFPGPHQGGPRVVRKRKGIS